jgi:TetR/AcrR family transcriptional regulator of autoinduction and epiphytic fitness
MTTAPVADGRSARSAKTRDAIADALLDLLIEGHLRPTAKEIAERASVSVRSVYVHFDDLEDLFVVAADRHFARISPMFEDLEVDGPYDRRVQAFVARRIRIYTQLGAVGRATQLQAPFSPTLARLVRAAQDASRRELERVFAPELDLLDVRTRARALALLDVVSGADAWDTLRTGHGLSIDATTIAMTGAISAQLGVSA